MIDDLIDSCAALWEKLTLPLPSSLPSAFFIHPSFFQLILPRQACKILSLWKRSVPLDYTPITQATLEAGSEAVLILQTALRRSKRWITRRKRIDSTITFCDPKAEVVFRSQDDILFRVHGWFLVQNRYACSPLGAE